LFRAPLNKFLSQWKFLWQFLNFNRIYQNWCGFHNKETPLSVSKFLTYGSFRRYFLVVVVMQILPAPSEESGYGLTPRPQKLGHAQRTRPEIKHGSRVKTAHSRGSDVRCQGGEPDSAVDYRRQCKNNLSPFYTALVRGQIRRSVPPPHRVSAFHMFSQLIDRNVETTSGHFQLSGGAFSLRVTTRILTVLFTSKLGLASMEISF